MSSDSPAASSISSRETSRRRLLAFLGAGGLGALATLFTRQEAHAGHDGTNVMHIGEVNSAPAGASTELRADVDGGAIHVRNFHAGLSSGAVGARCDDGIGVSASSERGIAAFFQTATGQALEVNGPANLVTSTDNRPALAVQNLNDSAGSTAIRAITRGGGTALTAESFASPSEETGAVAILGVSRAEGEPEALGSGVGVEGVSGSGVGVVATCFDGIALVVNGKAAFGTGGTDVIPAGQNSAFVPFPLVTVDSHISVTLVGDPGPRLLAWVERSPGSGFAVHLTSAPANKRPETPFTFLVVEGVDALKGLELDSKRGASTALARSAASGGVLGRTHTSSVWALPASLPVTTDHTRSAGPSF